MRADLHVHSNASDGTDLGIGASSLVGTYFAALPLLRALRRRLK